jgi:hypothetical protein
MDYDKYDVHFKNELEKFIKNIQNIICKHFECKLPKVNNYANRLVNHNIFIWNEVIRNLEGISKSLNIIQSKKEWMKINSNAIFKKINSNYNQQDIFINDELNRLKKFIDT